MRRLMVVGAALLAACQSDSSVTRSAPVATEVRNSVVIAEPFETVWDRLIRNLSSDFFVINNVEKASRIMNVTFGTQEPSDFIDCGTSRRTFEGPSGGQEVYNYQNAASTYSFRGSDKGQPYEIARQQSLEGRINIYVAPKGSATEVVVNARYTMTSTSYLTMLQGIYLNPVGSQALPTEVHSLDTSRPVTVPGGGSDPGFTCRANGKLEQRILDAASAG